LTLGDRIREALAHVMHQKVRIQVGGLTRKCGLGAREEPVAMAAPVVRDGVWQVAHPTLMNCARPAIVEGVGSAGTGGASMRMKSANASMSESVDVV
jgi:hypothetical protein